MKRYNYVYVGYFRPIDSLEPFPDAVLEDFFIRHYHHEEVEFPDVELYATNGRTNTIDYAKSNLTYSAKTAIMRDPSQYEFILYTFMYVTHDGEEDYGKSHQVTNCGTYPIFRINFHDILKQYPDRRALVTRAIMDIKRFDQVAPTIVSEYATYRVEFKPNHE